MHIPWRYLDKKQFLHFLVWFLLWVLFESAGGIEVILVWHVTLF
jgi:hypothetical protein